MWCGAWSRLPGTTERSRKLPLSDEAVLADLEGRGLNEVSRLALGGSAAAAYQG